MNPIRLLFVINAWRSENGGIQTVNRKLATAIGIARSDVATTCLALNAAPSDLTDAERSGVRLVSTPQPNLIELARSLFADGIHPLAVVGHGRISGDDAGKIRAACFPDSRLVHFVHVNPFDVEGTKEYREAGFVAEREHRLREELELAAKADIVVCIGPRLYRAMEDRLRSRGWAGRAVQIDCGISRAADKHNSPRDPLILYVGRTDSTRAKGLDLLSAAIGCISKDWLKDPRTKRLPLPRLVVRGARGSCEDLERSLTSIATRYSEDAVVRVRPYTTDEAEIAQDFQSASVLVMPSREEGFGLVAAEALSRCVPIILSAESGLAEILMQAAHENCLDLGPTVVRASGKNVSSVARRFASAIQEILADSSAAQLRTYVLREALHDRCSWDRAADTVLKVVGVPASSISGARHAREIVDRAGASNSTSSHAAATLLKRRAEFLKMPGVSSVGLREVIVVSVTPDQEPKLPANIDGVDVIVEHSARAIVRSGTTKSSELTLVCPTGRCTVGVFGRLLTGEIVAVVPAHVVIGSSGGYRVVVGDPEVHVSSGHLIEVDSRRDVALVKLDDEVPFGQRVSAADSRKMLGQRALLKLPGRTLNGALTGLQFTIHIGDGGDETVLEGLVEIAIDEDLRDGDSGSLATTEAGQPVGIVVAGTQGDHRVAYCIDLRRFAEERGLELILPRGTSDRVGTSRHRVLVLCASPGLGSQIRSRLCATAYQAAAGQSYAVGKLAAERRAEIMVVPVGLGTGGHLEYVMLRVAEGYSPDLVIFAGGATGLKARDARVGDVVIANSVINFDPFRGGGHGRAREQMMQSLDARLRQIVSQIAGRSGSGRLHPIRLNQLGVGVQGRGRLFVGALASGMGLVGSMSGLDDALQQWGNVVALDVDAGRYLSAVMAMHRGTPFVAVLAIANVGRRVKRAGSAPSEGDVAAAAVCEAIVSRWAGC